jgi:uncharacterized protein (TIGR02284 family)
MEKENTSTLDDLIEINNDRIEGYEKASTQTTDGDLRSLFSEMASQSRQFGAELKGYVRSEGEEPAKGTTIRGKIYRAWMDVKATFRGDDRKAVLESCEFGEDAAQRAYKAALKEEDVTENVRNVIEKQQSELKKSHDRIRDLRDSEPTKS